MEPIRPKQPVSSRRRLRGTASSGKGEVGEQSFDRHLAAEAARGLEQPPASEVDQAGGSHPLAGLPGVDAPTEELFDAVHLAGQRLLDERTYSAVQQYREAVRRFVGKVLAQANSVEIHESGPGLISRKRYYLITEINRSVERLLEGLQRTQSQQLEILSRLEEIEGMLVDLFQ
ncbi:hypothetical protein SAMN05920897_11662 [Alkalispirochaeta americana]|uniref:DUF327 domain-containing protein n=1 Tax=Alkalispirochaeta americana TaxID=159291 RepID=A0A1N6W2D8_9SPIO|nr:YaaR family protein [Alkalispirochaeta americana]SIQ84343.1 hypothetical protein SAMN05920897_11662 [Alkalispirochaeta americana]